MSIQKNNNNKLNLINLCRAIIKLFRKMYKRKLNSGLASKIECANIV